MFLFCEELVEVVFAFGFAETTGVVGDAAVDTSNLEAEDGLGEVGLEVVFERGHEDLLLTPGVADAIGVEHERDGERAEGLIVDGDESRGIRDFAFVEGVASLCKR